MENMSIINQKNLQETRRQIEKLYKEKKKIIIKSQSDDFNRKILENNKMDILILSLKNKRNPLKQRDSGLNEVLCKLATKNKITLAFDVNEIKQAQSREKAEILARLQQNLKLCKRTKTNIKILGKYNKQQVFSLLLTLQASTNQAKHAVS